MRREEVLPGKGRMPREEVLPGKEGLLPEEILLPEKELNAKDIISAPPGWYGLQPGIFLSC